MLTKAAPYFQPFDTEVVELGHEQLTLGSESAQVTYELIDGSIKVAEARWTLEDVAAPTGPARRAAVQAALRASVAVSDSPDTLVEEYVWAPGDSPTAVCVRRSK